MNEIRSSKKIMYRLLLLVFIGILGFASFHFFNEYDSHSYLKAGNIIFSIVFFLVFLVCILIYMNVKDVAVTSTQAEFKSYLGYQTMIIRLTDITAYALQALPNRYGKDSESLTLFTKDGEVLKLKGSLYTNYDELKTVLIHNATRDEKLEAQLQNETSKKAAFVMISIGIILLTGSFLTREKVINAKDVVFIKDMAADNIQLTKGRKGNSSSLTIDLMKYQDFNFKISDLGFSASDSEGALSEIHTMDSISVGIKKEDYDKKIGKTVTPNFFDIYFGYKNIKVYELGNKKQEFLSIENYNQVIRKHIFFGMGFFSLIGVVFLGLGIFSLFKVQQKASEI